MTSPIDKLSDALNSFNAAKTQRAGETSSSFASLLSTTGNGTMDDIFEKAAKTYGLPVELLKAVGKVESNFNAYAVSPSGARGVMQLMPGTAEYLGVNDSFDAEQNIMGGAKYLSQMLSMFNNDVRLALAAYNAGPGNVSKYGGVPPFAETQAYLSRVLEYLGQGGLSASGSVSYTRNISYTPASDETQSLTSLLGSDISSMLLSQMLDRMTNKDEDDKTNRIPL